MDFRQLRYFTEIAVLKNVSRASERLKIAQPALSRQIRLLEEELDVKLFKRQHSGVTLTEAGEQLLSHARVIARHLERAKQEVSNKSKGPGGWVGIGGPPSINEYLYPILVERFREHYPKVVLHLVDGMSTPLLERLARKEIDLAIIASAAVQPSIEVEIVAREKLLLVGPADDVAIGTEPIEFSRLQDFPLILTGRHNRTRRALEDMAAATDVNLNPIIEVESLSTMKRLIMDGHGYSLLPPSAVAVELAQGTLKSQQVKSLHITRYLASRVDDAPSPALDALKAEVRKGFAQLIETAVVEAP
jgi:LysR family nitrogen assimilation transcriptional regulator